MLSVRQAGHKQNILQCVLGPLSSRVNPNSNLSPLIASLRQTFTSGDSSVKVSASVLEVRSMSDGSICTSSGTTYAYPTVRLLVYCVGL